MSSSDVRRTASSKAKFGAAENGRVLLANSCIHRAGLLQKRHRAREHCMKSQDYRGGESE